MLGAEAPCRGTSRPSDARPSRVPTHGEGRPGDNPGLFRGRPSADGGGLPPAGEGGARFPPEATSTMAETTLVSSRPAGSFVEPTLGTDASS